MTYQDVGFVMPWLADNVSTRLFGDDKGYDKSTDPGIDLIRIWSAMQLDLGKKYGVYRDKNGDVIRFEGMYRPKLTKTQVNDLWKSWSDIGLKVEDALSGRPELMARGNAARARYIADYSLWYSKWAALPAWQRGYEKGYLWPHDVNEVFLIISRYMKALNGIIWAIPNIKSQYERWMSVLPWGYRQTFQLGWVTAESVVPAVSSAVDDIADNTKASVSFLWKIWKYRFPITVGAVGIFAYAKYGSQIKRKLKK